MKKSWIVVAALIPLVVIGSVAVWQVSGSEGRRLGALSPLKESIPLAWRGGYSLDTAYAAGDVVSYEGAAYVAQQEASVKPDPKCEAEVRGR